MTIGQKIAKLRKEQHLSQEELGAQLGVSRQSIYKWESDGSMPEIEKLIALSRCFSVSVGWLLGVEEEPRAAQAEAGLSEEQLQMAQEIARRYLEQQPQPPAPRRRRLWPVLGALAMAAAAALGLNLHAQLRRMEQRYNSLQNQVADVQSTVSGSIAGISGRVEEILKSQNQLTADYGSEVESIDPKNNTVTFSVHAIPKSYGEGMQAVFCAASGGEVTEVQGAPGKNLEFSARITCPLTDEVRLSVIFISGEKKESQYLDDYYALLSASYPAVDVSETGLFWLKSKDGLVKPGQCYLIAKTGEDSTGERAGAVNIRPGLFKNRELIAWGEATAVPPGYTGYNDCSFFALPLGMKIPLTPEDTLETAALVTDEHGRQFIQVGSVLALDEDGDLLPASGGVRLGMEPAEGWKFG